MGKKKKSLRREIIEWSVFLGILAIVYLTGWHTELGGGLQRLFLSTGFSQAQTLDKSEQAEASFNLSLLSGEGKQISLEDLKGKTLFINFWATWCPPCIAEMPDINKLYSKIDKNKVAFVMVSLDDDFAAAQKFMQRKGFDFPIYALQSPLPRVYYEKSIPRTYVVSPKGKIIVKKIGMAKYNTENFRKLLIDAR